MDQRVLLLPLNYAKCYSGWEQLAQFKPLFHTKCNSLLTFKIWAPKGSDALLLAQSWGYPEKLMLELPTNVHRALNIHYERYTFRFKWLLHFSQRFNSRHLQWAYEGWNLLRSTYSPQSYCKQGKNIKCTYFTFPSEWFRQKMKNLIYVYLYRVPTKSFISLISGGKLISFETIYNGEWDCLAHLWTFSKRLWFIQLLGDTDNKLGWVR